MIDGPRPPRSSWPATARDPACDATMSALRRRVWQDQGIAVLRLMDLADDWERQAVTGIATRLYGRRATQEGNR